MNRGPDQNGSDNRDRARQRLAGRWVAPTHDGQRHTKNDGDAEQRESTTDTRQFRLVVFGRPSALRIAQVSRRYRGWCYGILRRTWVLRLSQSASDKHGPRCLVRGRGHTGDRDIAIWNL
jgi:hypothetical protein